MACFHLHYIIWHSQHRQTTRKEELQKKSNEQANEINELKNEKDPKEVQKLLAKKKELYSVRRANRIETVEKAASAALGTAIGVKGNEFLQNLIHGTPDQTNAAKPDGTGTEPADTTQTLEKILNLESLLMAVLLW